MPFSRLEHDFIMQHCCCLNCKFMTLHKLYTVLKVPLKYNKPQVENVARGGNSVRLTYMVTSISTYIHLFSSARRPATLRARYTNRLNPENNRCIRNVPLPLYRPRTGAISSINYCHCRSLSRFSIFMAQFSEDKKHFNEL